MAIDPTAVPCGIPRVAASAVSWSVPSARKARRQKSSIDARGARQPLWFLPSLVTDFKSVDGDRLQILARRREDSMAGSRSSHTSSKRKMSQPAERQAELPGCRAGPLLEDVVEPAAGAEAAVEGNLQDRILRFRQPLHRSREAIACQIFHYRNAKHIAKRPVGSGWMDIGAPSKIRKAERFAKMPVDQVGQHL